MDQKQCFGTIETVEVVQQVDGCSSHNKPKKKDRKCKEKPPPDPPKKCCAIPGCTNCKLCLRPVTVKTGLQCCGECRTWYHFVCLGYTPGKIKDILDGLIRVKCPCPDCTTKEPREFLVVQNEHCYTCTNRQCPANRPKICQNQSCPSNKDLPKDPSEWPSLSCSKGACKRYLDLNCQNEIPLIPGKPLIKTHASSDEDQCPVGCVSEKDSSSSSDISMVMEQLTNTVGELTNELNELMFKMKETVLATSENNKCCSKTPCNCPNNPKKKNKHGKRSCNAVDQPYVLGDDGTQYPKGCNADPNKKPPIDGTYWKPECDPANNPLLNMK